MKVEMIEADGQLSLSYQESGIRFQIIEVIYSVYQSLRY